ncbi:MAG TPA: chorismate mutase [Polyangiaceae bacterium]|nr:chorismate mutase [Polyangiaceae bacterium]
MNSQSLSRDFTDSLLEYRRELDVLDEEFVKLLAARFSVTRRIGALKATHGAGAADSAREQAQLDRLLSLSENLGLPTELTREVYETVFRFVRAGHLAQAKDMGAGTAKAAP